MEITREMVEEALDFYRLDDPDYRKNCFDCVEEIKGNEALSKKIDEVTDAFFVTEHGAARSLYRKQTIKEIFGGVKNNYIGNVVFFSGCRRHKENIKKMNFDEFQTERQIMGVRGSLTFDKDGLGMRYFSWGSVFIRCDIIKAGNLQFERVIHSPSAETIEPPKCAHIHIPRGADISRGAVEQTLIEGKKLVLKYFGPGFEQRYCDSWLLCPYLQKILPPTSNILAFQSFFDITETKDATASILFFAFRKEKDFPLKDLPEDTSLQRSLKAALLRGEVINLGLGRVKDRF